VMDDNAKVFYFATVERWRHEPSTGCSVGLVLSNGERIKVKSTPWLMDAAVNRSTIKVTIEIEGAKRTECPDCGPGYYK
jgi:hypothetical protein